jgi:hypothetical protein
MIELSVCIHPIYLHRVHGGNDERQALAIPGRHDKVCDIDRIMVELDSEARLFTPRRLRTYSKLINLLPCTQRVGADGFQDRKEAISRDDGSPGLEVNIAEIQRHVGAPDGRGKTEDVAEAAAGVGRLRNVLLPEFELHILADGADMLACERAVPGGLVVLLISLAPNK